MRVSADESAAGWVDVGFFPAGKPGADGVPGTAAKRLGVVKWSVWVRGRFGQPIEDSALAVDDADFVFRRCSDVGVRVFWIDPADGFFAAVLEADGIREFRVRVRAFLRDPFDPCAEAVEDGNLVVRLRRDR